MEYLINAANALYLLAYFLRDMRWLRAFTIVAASLLAGYFFLLPQPVMAAVYWNLLFAALNAVQLLRLVAPARSNERGGGAMQPFLLTGAPCRMNSGTGRRSCAFPGPLARNVRSRP